VKAKKQNKVAVETTDPVKEFYSQLGKKSAAARKAALLAKNGKGDQ